MTDITSIIIPTWNGEDRIGRLLDALKSQSIACEIIVLDSSSDDGTARVAAERGANVISIDRTLFDHGGTRNMGVRAASGDIIVFLTQDALPADDHLVANLTGPLKMPGITLAYGRQTAGDGATPPEKFARMFNYPEKAFVRGIEDVELIGVRAFFCSNVCSAVRRREFEQVGRFPEGIVMNEDMVLAARMMRAGYRVAYEPSAVVRHWHNYSLWEQFKRYFDIGAALRQSGLASGTKRAEGEGLQYLRKQTSYLAGEKEWYWIPYAFAEAAVKYSAFRLGFLEGRIPSSLKVRLSMHAGFWLRPRS